MKYTRKSRARVIDENNALAFEEKLNEALMEDEADIGKIHYSDSNRFYAVVYYTASVPVAENHDEELIIKHGEHNCTDCPYFERSMDKRKKWHICTKDKKPITEFHDACIVYYEILEEIEKEVELVSGIREKNGRNWMDKQKSDEFLEDQRVASILQAQG